MPRLKTRRVIGSAMTAMVLLAGCSASGASPSAGSESPAAVSASPSSIASLPSVATLPGGRIAFDRVSADGRYAGTYVGVADGSKLDQVPVGFAPGETVGPHLSPDGGMLLANTYAGGDASRSWITNLATAQSTLLDPPSLVAGAGIDCAAWSSDGLRLLCSVDADETPNVEGIYELTIASLELRRLTQGNPSVVGSEGECGGNDSSPVYSPDGTKFAFIRLLCGQQADPGRDQTAALMIENLDGSGLTEAVAPGGIFSHAGGIDWTANGDWIVFVTESGGLTLVHPDGTANTAIHLDLAGTTSNGFAQQPAWSPDGTWLIFSLFMGDEDQFDLYAATPDGQNLTRIAGGSDAEVSASWRPAP